MSLENDEDMVTTMQLANRYQVTPSLLQRWREGRDFPEHAVERRGQYTYWSVSAVDAYLRDRLAKKAKTCSGPRPRWSEVVQP